MSPQASSPFPRQAEALLGTLAGVVSAHVVTDAQGTPVEIHILAHPGLHPKQVVRNVESALSAGLGVPVDRRIISVAQIRATGGAQSAGDEPGEADDDGDELPEETGEAEAGPEGHAGRSAPEDAPGTGHTTANGDERTEQGRSNGTRRREDAGITEPAPATGEGGRARPVGSSQGSRLEFVRYESRRDRERCRCDVTLRSGGGTVKGSASGPDTAHGRAEAAAKAVLEAVARARDVRLALDGAVITEQRGRSFVLVSAHALEERETLQLAGAALLSRSPEEAAILAALQATNRWSG